MLREDIEKEVTRRKSFYLNEDKAKVFEKYKDKYSMIANRINSIIQDSLCRINYTFTTEQRQSVYNYIEHLLLGFVKMYCEENEIGYEVNEAGQLKIVNQFVFDKMWVDIYELYELLERVNQYIASGDIENTKHR